MTKLLKVAAATCLMVASTFAAPLYNVTVGDGHPLKPHNEDQEMDAGKFLQYQEVEAFLWNGSDVSLVGGYNFRDGYVYGGDLISTGDVFVDLERDGSYDLALQFDFDNLVYNVIDVVSTVDVTYKDHTFASPFTAVGTYIGSGILKYETGLSDDEIGFGLKSDAYTPTHNKVTMLGVNSFGISNDFGLHYTMLCGNDVVKASVPEPALISLLGVSFLGFAFVRKKKFN